MATPKVFVAATDNWVDVIGSAASVAGMTWQAVGNAALLISFTTAAPVSGSATDAVHQLKPGDSYYDKNGSAHCWVKRMGRGNVQISGTAD